MRAAVCACVCACAVVAAAASSCAPAPAATPATPKPVVQDALPSTSPNAAQAANQAAAARAFTFLEPAMASCFGVAPDAHGTLTIIVELGPADAGAPTGEPPHAAVKNVSFTPSSTLNDSGVRSCIARVVSRSTDFPDSGAGALVSTTLAR